MRFLSLFLSIWIALFCGDVFAGGSKVNSNVISVKNSSQELIVDIHLDADFYKDFKLDKSKIAAEEVTLRNQEKQWFSFKPIDHDSLRASKGYFSKVWSPDNDYLVLPLGRFEGFAIFSATYIQNSMSRLVTKQYYGADIVPEKTLKVISEFGPALWHQFLKWEGSHILVFNVGLGKDIKIFKFDIDKNTLTGYKHWKGQLTQSHFLATE